MFVCLFVAKLVFGLYHDTGRKKARNKISLMMKHETVFSFCYDVKNLEYNRNPIQLEVLNYLYRLMYIVFRRFLIELRTSGAYLFPQHLIFCALFMTPYIPF